MAERLPGELREAGVAAMLSLQRRRITDLCDLKQWTFGQFERGNLFPFDRAKKDHEPTEQGCFEAADRIQIARLGSRAYIRRGTTQGYHMRL